ncbi:MAG: hypothetical protein WAV20_21195, partial [Blastocatellia bacterium]
MTASELAGDALLRARRQISRAISRATDTAGTVYVSDADLRGSLDGRSIAEVAASIRERSGPRLTPGLADLLTTVATLKEFFPDSL